MFQSPDTREVRISRTRASKLSRRARTALAIVERLEERTLLTTAAVTVSPGVMDGWAFDSRDPNGNIITTGPAVTGEGFVNGPSTPPLGTGSANLFTGNGTLYGDYNAEVRNSSYSGVLLSDLTSLSYSTYATSWNGQQLPFLGLNIALDGNVNSTNPSDYDILFFEPTYQSPATGNPSLPNQLATQGPVQLNTWQTWNALEGGWWSDDNTLGASPGTYESATNQGVQPLSAFITAYPNATIVNTTTGEGVAPGLGGVRIDVGEASPTDSFNGYVDNVTIGDSAGTTTYNFENTAPTTVYVNASWAGLLPGQTPPDSAPGTVIGANGFATIQDGVNAVASGGTVDVAAGTYNELVTITKPVTLNGAEAGVDARTRTAVPESIVGSSVGAFQIEADHVTINGFTVQGVTADPNVNPASLGVGIWTNPGFSGTHGGFTIVDNIIQDNIAGMELDNDGTFLSTVQDNLIQNNTAPGAGSGNGIQVSFGLSNTLIDNNAFKGQSNAAIVTEAPSGTNGAITISNNQITNGSAGIDLFDTSNTTIQDNTITDPAGDGIAIAGGDSNIGIASNTIQSTVSGDSGVSVSDPYGIGANSGVVISNNVLTGNANTYGVRIESANTAYSDANPLLVKFNNLSGNGVGIQSDNSTAMSVDASANYWGSSNPSTVQSMIAGANASTVDFTPLLDNAGTNDAPGYTPDLSAVTVHSLGIQIGTTARIQEGINLVSSGGTVYVAAGTYTGAVDATGKTVTLAIGGPSTTGIVTNNGNLTLGSTDTLAFKVNGAVPGTNFDQWVVNGVVTLNNATLATSGTGSAPVWPLILNKGTSPVVGTFLNQPEASTVVVNGVSYGIRYDFTTNGTSNNVVLYQGADLSIGISGPSTVVAGDPAGFNYTIVVTNTGPVNNTGGFTVTDTLPAGLTFQSAGSTPGTVVSGSTVSFTNSSGLTRGASETIVIHVTLASSVPTGTQFTDSATVTSNGTADYNSANNTATTTTTTVSTQTDLAVTNTLNGPTQAGQTQTFTVTITNNGPSDAIDVALTDKLPQNCVLVSETQNSGPVFNITSATANGVVTLNGTTPTLGAGASATFTIVTRLASPEPNGFVISSTATVSSNTPDTNPANNQSIAKGVLNNETTLSLTTTASPNPVSPAGKLAYTLTVTDTGPNPAQDVVLVDTLPANATLRAVQQTSGPAASVSAPAIGSAGGKVTWTIATLAPGQSATFIIVVTPTSTARSLTNQASVTCSNVNPNAGTPTTTTVTTVSSSTPATVVIATVPNSKSTSKSV